MPTRIEYQRGTLALPERLTHSLNASVSPKLNGALQRFAAQVAAHTGVLVALSSSLSRPFLDFQVDAPATDVPRLDTDESYQLVIDANGVTVTAATLYGAMKGLQTLRQLLVIRPDGQLELPFVRIYDRPRFPWRGMMLDSARHFLPVAAVKRMLDAMEMVKLNVLHLHLTDDQGFRIESIALPELHRKGSNGEFYTREDMKGIVAYAADRGIRVVPEFGLPGHSTSWQIGYPALASTTSAPTKTGVHGGIFSDPVNPALESTYTLIDTLIQDMAPLFPDRYWHIGGDEVDDSAWQENKTIQQFMQAQNLPDSRALQGYFTARYVALLNRHGKTAVGWQEILHPDIPAETVIHLWMGNDYDAALKRHSILTSRNYYLDHQQPAWYMYRRAPDAFEVPALDSSARRALDANMLGAEIANWAETVNGSNIDLRTWPRSAAIAELLWSTAEHVAATTREDLYRRLEAVDTRMHRAGIDHRRQARKGWATLAHDGDLEALSVLASVLEPAGMHPLRSRKTLSKLLLSFVVDVDYPVSDVNRLVEFLPAESIQARSFNTQVDQYLAGNRELAETINLQLQIWANNHARLADTIAGSPQLRDAGIDQVSASLQQVAEIGIIAMKLLASRETPGIIDRWRLREQLDDYAYNVHEFNTPAGLRAFAADLLKPDPLNQHNIAIHPGVARLLEAALNQ